MAETQATQVTHTGPKYQLLSRIIPDGNSQNPLKVAEELFTTATKRGFQITKLKVYWGTPDGAPEGDKVLVVIFETQTRPDQKFPGVFSVHRRAVTETHYTLNALEAARGERKMESDEQLFETLKSTLLTLHDGKLVVYNLSQVKSYVRHNGSWLAL